jgi:porin
MKKGDNLMTRHVVNALLNTLLVLAVSVTTAYATQPEPIESGGSVDPSSQTSTMATSQPKTQAAKEEMPWLIPYTDYGGDLWSRPTLTGDWFGLRQDLMDHGIRFDVNSTQTFQGVWSGGKSHESTYQGGLDLIFQLDTGKAGLWPGGVFRIKGEVRYGQDANGNTGSLMPVNFDALYPIPGRDGIELSEFNYTQFLAPWVAVTLGRFSPRDANVFAHDETGQFLNTAFNINPVIVTTIPQTFLGAGVILLPAEDVVLTTLVLDSEGKADESGFNTAFERGTSVFQQLEIGIKPFGLPGHQRVGWTWSDKSRIKLEQVTSEVFLDWINYRLGFGPMPTLAHSNSDWSFFYDFDQYLYVVPGTEDRGIGVFGRFGLTDGEVNPIGSFYSLGLGGKGMIPGRENDTFGVGYYYLALSDKLGPVLSKLGNDEQGVEIYYNIAVTPWCHITPDIQIINPASSSSDTAVAGGIRMKIDF